MNLDTVRVYAASGMTCQHCVLAVTEEVAEVDGVERVHVDLAGGQLTVQGSGFAAGSINAAVVEAGYAVIS